MHHAHPHAPRRNRRWLPPATVVLAAAVAPCLMLFNTPTALVAATAVVAPWLLLLVAHHRHQQVTGGLWRRIHQLRVQLALAHTDPVTGVATRHVAQAHLNQATTHVTVALVDVDDLRGVNNTHGHLAGDAYLAAVAEALTTLIAGQEGTLLARLGGDEFLLTTPGDPHVLAAGLTGLLGQRIRLADQVEVGLRFSAGICRLPGGDAHTALGCADLAMYTAKRSGGGIAHYDPHRDGTPHPAGTRPTRRPRDRDTGAR